ncbi:hypothetical protein BH18VER1_BH18VER1_12040 [soil metagenome]
MVLLCAAIAVARPAGAYILNDGKKWPASSEVVLHINLGNSARPLLDGSTSWNTAVLPVLDMWNQKIGGMQLVGVISPNTAARNGDRVNSVVFGSSAFGQSFGKYTLALTFYTSSGSSLVETDVIFNQAMVFDSYDGGLRFPAGGGIAIADIRRVFLHELGHGIGLNHPDGAGQHVDAVMNAMISDRDRLAPDDISGAHALYGAPRIPTSTPTPTPAPTATPTPTPVSTATPTPTPAAQSHLANIATRMNVGVNDNVLIAGFIVHGAQPKKVILRAIGPSLNASGISGAMADPVLELYNSAGNMIADNDDWRGGTQAAQISATGIAPVVAAESALIATLPADSYTAVVHGSDNKQGVAIVELYELDGTATRLVNISTRGRIGVGDQALIGGVIVQGSAAKKVIMRALGPSLVDGGLVGTLANPHLELHDGSGNLISVNDNWNTGPQAAEIAASGVPPQNALESALIARLAPGNYTAVVRGVNSGTGIGLIEIFDLEP